MNFETEDEKLKRSSEGLRQQLLFLPQFRIQVRKVRSKSEISDEVAAK